MFFVDNKSGKRIQRTNDVVLSSKENPMFVTIFVSSED